MKFSLGDTVYLRQTEEEGVITAFLSATLYEVEAGGVRFPVFAEEVEHPYLRRFRTKGRPRAEKELPLPVPEKKKPERLPQGSYLAFMPLYGEGEAANEIRQVRIQLLNELPDAVRFSYDLRNARRQSLFALSGQLPAYSHLYLHTIDWETMAAQPRFHWSLQPMDAGRLGPEQQGVVRLQPRQLIPKIQALEASGNPMFSEMLVDQFTREAGLPEVGAIRMGLETVGGAAGGGRNFQPVLDLHASALLAQPEDYLPPEIFRMQLEKLYDFLQEALLHDCREVTLIHGVGNGLLRRAVEEVLAHHPDVRSQESDWHPRYGFGATRARLHSRKGP